MDELRRFFFLALMVLAITVMAIVACGSESTPGDDAPSGGGTQVGSDSSGTGTTSSGDTPAEGGTAATPTPARTSAPSGDRLSVQEYLDLCASEPVLEDLGDNYGDWVVFMDSISEHYAVDPPEELSEWNDLTLKQVRSYREYYSRFPKQNLIPLEFWTDEEFVALDKDFEAELDEALENIADGSLRADMLRYGCHPYYESEALTTQGYAGALEEAFWERDDELEKATVDLLLGGAPFTSAEYERVESLEAAESWSEEDAAFASEFAETLLRAITDFIDFASEVARDTVDELSGLEPPEHLADLHEDFTSAYGENLRFAPELVDFLKDADTRIRDREDLADFYTVINAAEPGQLDPGLGAKAEELAAKAERLAAQAGEACQALKDQLEAELERDIDISCEFE